MTAPLIVTNLPPGISIEEIKKAFQPYGPIHVIFQCMDHYLNINYSLNSAYVYFEEKRSIEFFLEDYVDVVINGYFTDIQSVEDSPLPKSTAVIYGITQGITKSDLYYALRLDKHSEISIQKPGSPQNDGYAFVTFQYPKYCSSFLMSHTEVTIGSCQMAIKPYPQPQIPPKQQHTAIVSCAPSSFIKLRGLKKFQDFTIHTPSKDYFLSSQVLAASSQIIHDLTDSFPPVLSFTIMSDKGNYDEIFDALYGAPLEINQDNCLFILEVASLLLIPDLITVAGSVAYEFLTLDNFKKQLLQLIDKKINYDYIIDFLGAHLTEINQLMQRNEDILIDLPSEALKKLAHHPSIQTLKIEDATGIFKNVLVVGTISKSDISHVYNSKLDVNSNRELLLDYLESKKATTSIPSNENSQRQTNPQQNNQENAPPQGTEASNETSIGHAPNLSFDTFFSDSDIFDYD
ncbi:hypothetical protein M9Y10_039346 [Tritrichomonas musculus]|uniref:RRM domain-containing protein n=1 Tax=Tritrichomonas musculus TaxID=1915356 RepID=A0ABR2KAZ3_9EUKA